MTYERRTDPNAMPADETHVVERGYVPPAAQPAGSQVNVNAGGSAAGTTYVEPASPGPLYYARRIVSLLFTVLAVLIGLRILLLLFVANPGNAIVDFVYSVTEPFVAPFRGMFSFDQVSAGDATLDIAAVVALIGWLLIYLLLMAILSLGDRRRAA
jgi:uncharacterized protein YggT (Ycf19 family)